MKAKNFQLGQTKSSPQSRLEETEAGHSQAKPVPPYQQLRQKKKEDEVSREYEIRLGHPTPCPWASQEKTGGTAKPSVRCMLRGTATEQKQEEEDNGETTEGEVEEEEGDVEEEGGEGTMKKGEVEEEEEDTAKEGEAEEEGKGLEVHEGQAAGDE